MNDIAVVVADLRTDATQWDRVSEELDKAKKSASDNCELGYAVFDGISHGLGATTAYETAFEQLFEYLKSGVNETAHIADRLRATATTMENEDYYG